MKEGMEGEYCSQLYTCCPIIVLVTDTLANGNILQESKILENPFLEKKWKLWKFTKIIGLAKNFIKPRTKFSFEHFLKIWAYFVNPIKNYGCFVINNWHDYYNFK